VSGERSGGRLDRCAEAGTGLRSAAWRSRSRPTSCSGGRARRGPQHPRPQARAERRGVAACPVDLIGSRTLLAAIVFTVVGIAAGWALSAGSGTTRTTTALIAPTRNAGPAFAASPVVRRRASSSWAAPVRRWPVRPDPLYIKLSLRAARDGIPAGVSPRHPHPLPASMRRAGNRRRRRMARLSATSPRMDAGGRGRRLPSYSRPTDARPRAARPTSLASGAAVHRPTATGLTRRIRCFFVGVLEPCASVDVLNESREPHHHAGVPLPPVGVGRMAAPTVRVRLVSLPKTINHFGALSTRGQLGHERPEHLRRTRTDGIR